MGSIRRMVQDIRYVLSGVAAFIIFRDFCRGYGILQNTWSTAYYSRECRKGLWPIRKTPIKLFWPPTVPHVKWNAGFFFSLFMSSYIHQRFSMDYAWNIVFLRYGLEWRGHRRFFHEHFNPNVIHKYDSAQIITTRAFLRLLLKSPDDFVLHIRQ